jgi:hypothetical protein
MQITCWSNEKGVLHWGGGGNVIPYNFFTGFHPLLLYILQHHCCTNLGVPVYKIYWVSHEEKSIFWEVIVLAILSKKVCMYTCSIPNSFQDTTYN